MPNNEPKRIKFTINLPSFAFKKFMEKIIKDDDFFDYAMESPIGAMKQCGVNLDKSFTINDFIPFFSAVALVKEYAKEKKISDLSFENIFGSRVEIPNSSMMAEMDRGICQDFKKSAIQSSKTFKFTKTNFFTRVLQDRTIIKNTKIKMFINPEIIRTRDISIEGIDDLDEAIKDELLNGPLINPNDLVSITAKIQTFLQINEENK